MSRTRFVKNILGIAQLGKTSDMSRAMLEEAENAAQAARALAPVLTGAYRDSIHVVTTTFDGNESAEVVADVPYSDPIEFGTSDTPTFAPLRRGAESAGLRLGA